MRYIWLTICMILGLSSQVLADPVTLTWNANSEPDMSWYRIYKSDVSGTYNIGTPFKQVDKSITTTTFDIPRASADKRYYFVLTAGDTSNNESQKSNEVSKVISAIVVIPAELAVSVAGDPASAWNVTASVLNVTEPYDVQWYINGIFHHTDNVNPRCLWRLNGTSVCSGGVTAKAPGTYLVEARVIKAGVEVIRKQITVIVPVVDVPPVPPQGLIISKADTEEVVIVASVADCKEVVLSALGATELVHKFTTKCVR